MEGVEPPDPLPLETFIDYALWFQKNAAPNVDETYIKVIERTDDSSYRITLEDGRVVTSSAVVLAPGLQYYQYIPEFYAHLPHSLLSHTNEYKDLTGFAGKHVAMIGGGQAALECSALLNEQGAQVTVVVRRQLNWLSKGAVGTPFTSAIHAVRAPQAGMGDGWSNVILEKLPYLLHSTVKPWKNYVLGKMHGPAGSEWLKPRILGKVQVKEHANVVKVEAINDDTAVRLTLSTGEVLEVEHVILGTGFRPEVKSLPMLSQNIKDALRTYRGSPVLSSWFESSVPGMYFIGFSAARGFGPLYRFVIGSAAAARRTAAAAVRYAASVKSGARS
jgi:thioredoxin reductase